MGQKLIISESDKEHIRKLYRLKESKELDVFPIDGGFNIGYDKDWSNFSNPRSTANSFRLQPCDRSHGARPTGSGMGTASTTPVPYLGLRAHGQGLRGSGLRLSCCICPGVSGWVGQSAL